jgi:hypothetical protein
MDWANTIAVAVLINVRKIIIMFCIKKVKKNVM